MKKTLGIGLLGYGSIGKVHSLCYRELPMLYPGALPELDLAAVCTSSQVTAEKARVEGGYRKAYSSLDEMIDDPDIDVIDCSLPNNLRLKFIESAIAKGKHIYCEKPLAQNIKEAEAIASLVAASKICFGMTFNFRFIPAVLRAKELMDAGELGEVYHFHAAYYHTGYQNPQRPFSWRLSKEASGGGALVDMGAHIIDLMRFLVGDYANVRAQTKTWIKQRPASKNNDAMRSVDVDDAAWLQVEMKNGALGSLETSRFATGTLDDLVFDVYGSKGGLHFHLMDANWLYYFDESSPSGSRGGKRGWTRIETVQHYPGATTPPARSILGWTRSHAENQYQFLCAVAEGREPSPSVYDGLAVQRVLSAAYASAERKGEGVAL